MSDAVPTLDPDPEDEPSHRERLATLLERRLDIPMAVLAAIWAALVAYELVAPRATMGTLGLLGNIIWGIFALELLAKLVVSGRPLRFLRRHWPSVLFLLLPALRMLRVVRALRAVRVLPAARVVGSSYRAVGTARGLLAGRADHIAGAGRKRLLGRDEAPVATRPPAPCEGDRGEHPDDQHDVEDHARRDLVLVARKRSLST